LLTFYRRLLFGLFFLLFFRYKSLSPKERKILEEDEDELLGILLHNLVAFMVCMGLEKKNIKLKVRRLLAKSHIGMAQSQLVDKLLSSLNELTGNDIDLLVPRSKKIKIQNFVVHLGDTPSGLMFFLEVRFLLFLENYHMTFIVLCQYFLTISGNIFPFSLFCYDIFYCLISISFFHLNFPGT